MGIVSFRFQYSYTKLPFPPNHNPSRRCRVHVGPTSSPAPPTDRGRVWGATSSSSSSSSSSSKEKVVVVLGATGCGKSNISVDLATRLGAGAEIINSDKIQVHRGLDVTTNKIPIPDRRGVPHHLLGSSDPTRDITPSDFRLAAGNIVSGLSSSGTLPIVAGGSNSLVHALLVEDFDPEADFSSPARLRYDCCFLWVDVAPAMLDRYLRVRVDDMLESGMFEELDRFFARLMSGSGSGPEFRQGVGIMKAIGVPEFEGYFRKYPPGRRKEEWGSKRWEAYERAVMDIKENTCQLARRQVEKILRLRDVSGWDLQRINATASLEAKMERGRRRWAGVWEKEVLEPSMKIVSRFLED